MRITIRRLHAHSKERGDGLTRASRVRGPCVPLYRQSVIYASEGVELKRTLLADRPTGWGAQARQQSNRRSVAFAVKRGQ